MSQEKRIANLLAEMTRQGDPEKLREIADELEKYSDWPDAERARMKALEKEREQAEEAAWHVRRR